MEACPLIIAQQELTGWLSVLQSQAGVVAILVIIIVTGARGHWVFSREIQHCDKRIDKLERENDEQRRLIYELIGVQKSALKMAETAATRVVP